VRFIVRLLPLAAILALAGCSLAEDVTPPPGVAEEGLVRPAFVGEPTAAAPNTAPDPESGAAISPNDARLAMGRPGLAMERRAPSAAARPGLGSKCGPRRALADWYQMVTVEHRPLHAWLSVPGRATLGRAASP
jgi:hypothetical protein